MSNPWYRDYADWLSTLFEGKLQKITVDAGFSCPNRDGTIGRGGCSYCNNASFSPDTSSDAPDLESRLEAGKRFFAGKYPNMRYLAYFQSYTNTHGPREQLLDLYSRALAVDGVVGLIIGTRPDCVDAGLLQDIRSVAGDRPVIMEYGAESSHDSTLQAVNRCHVWADTVKAVELTAGCGLHCGLHFILGLPGETRQMMLETVARLNRLPVETVKFHQLQIIRGTRLAQQYEKGETDFIRFTPESYIELCIDIIERLRPDIAIERFVSQSPADLLIEPRWGLKNYQFVNLLNRALAQRNPR
ncbi:MAG: TIGR01212 family radical SAM protein [Muribaculaceae bacterium]|nr:TIGR01212 family radical SAM protein [Muribaculaceae bacterium]MDE5929794.1 TIGR01212 family radical SAM protein [Muribaculaceae bacterium]